MTTTVSTDDYHALDDAGQAVIAAWTEKVRGRPLDEPPFVAAMTLGEGYVEVDELPVDETGKLLLDARGRLAHRTVTYPAPDLPPFWPAGLAR